MSEILASVHSLSPPAYEPSSAPPSYNVPNLPNFDKYPTDVQENFKKFQRDLTHNMRRTAQQILTKEFSKPEVYDDLDKETKALIENVAATDKAFDDVLLDLERVDRYGLTYKGRPTTLGKDWGNLRESWKRILLDSRKAAVKTRGYCNAFLNIGMSNITKEKIKTRADAQTSIERLQRLVKSSNPFEGKYDGKPGDDLAWKTSTDFDDLKLNVKRFVDIYDEVMRENKKPMNIEITRLEGELLKVQAEIKAVERLIAALLVGLGICISIAPGAIGIALAGTLGPLGAGIAVGIGIAAIAGALATGFAALGVYIDKLLPLEKKKAEFESELANLKQRMAHLEAIKTELVAQKTNTRGIVSRVDCIKKIWDGLQVDGLTVADDLQNVFDYADPNDTEAFWYYVDTLKTGYSNLSKALNNYARGITGSPATDVQLSSVGLVGDDLVGESDGKLLAMSDDKLLAVSEDEFRAMSEQEYFALLGI